jgi:PAS domain-containing protein
MKANVKLDQEEVRKLEVRAEEVDLELDEAQQYLQLEQAAECAFILDCDMCVELWNAAAARTTGRTRGEVVGKPLRDILTSNKVSQRTRPRLLSKKTHLLS